MHASQGLSRTVTVTQYPEVGVYGVKLQMTLTLLQNVGIYVTQYPIPAYFCS